MEDNSLGDLTYERISLQNEGAGFCTVDVSCQCIDICNCDEDIMKVVNAFFFQFGIPLPKVFPVLSKKKANIGK